VKPLVCMLLSALVVIILLHGAAFAGDCWDPQGACPPPCPAENSCPGVPYGSGEGCPEGTICVPSCAPSWCFCDTQFEPASWACSLDCAGECYAWPEPAGPPTHTIGNLETPTGMGGIAYAINSYGHIAGALGGQPVLWVHDELIETGSPGVSAHPVDINNVGQVLIVSVYGNHVWLWDEDSGLQEIEELSNGYAINDAGQVVGFSSAGLGSVLWHDGDIIELWGTIGIGGTDINNLGQIAGNIPAEPASSHAAFWGGAQVLDLGTLGGLYSYATELNDLGQVIGRSERAPGGDRIFYSFLWDGERMHDVSDFVGYDVWRELELNNCGEVLLQGTGRSDEGFYVYHGEHGLRPVRGVYGPATGWWKLDVQDMNDRGEIVGMGQMPNGSAGAFVIKPLLGDLDWDGDADLSDCAEFFRRFTGPKGPDIPGCERADLERDADVDLNDFGMFQESLTSPK